MDNEQAKELWSKAKAYASRMGMERESEDFAQEVVERIWQGRKASIGQLYIDFLRERSGRKGERCYGRRAIDGIGAVSIQALEEKAGKPLDQLGGVTNSGVDFGLDALGYLKSLWDPKLRCIALLYHKWGFNEVEIGYLFGVTESRVSQWLKSIQSRLSERVKGEESAAQRARENCVEEVLQVEGWGVERPPNIEMARIESREMALAYETSFSAWLTPEVL